MNAYGKVKRALALLLLVSMLFGNNGILAYALDESGTADPSMEIVAETEELPDATTEQTIVTEQDQGNTTLAGAEQKGQQEVPGQGLPDQEQGLTTPVEGQPVLTDPELVSEQPTTSGEPPIAEQLPPEGNSVPTLQENLVPTQPEQTAITPAAVTPTRTHYDGTSYNTDIVAWADFESAEAISDSAVFTVTELDPDTGNYPYAAYAAALNAQGTTRYFDLAFLTAGEQKVECQPDGAVRITLAFPADSLTKDTRVTHLPLREELRAAVASTADATAITVDDVRIEEVRDLYIDTENSQVSFTADSLSVFAVTIPATEQKEIFDMESAPAKEELPDAEEASEEEESLDTEEVLQTANILDARETTGLVALNAAAGTPTVTIDFKLGDGSPDTEAALPGNCYAVVLNAQTPKAIAPIQISAPAGEASAFVDEAGNPFALTDLGEDWGKNNVRIITYKGSATELPAILTDIKNNPWNSSVWNTANDSFASAGMYALTYTLVDGSYRITARKKDVYTVTVKTYDHDGTTEKAPDPAFNNGYYLRVHVLDKDGDAIGWTLLPVAWTGSSTDVYVDKFVDLNSNPLQQQNGTPYDPSRHVIETSSIRLIRSADPYNPNLNNLGSYEEATNPDKVLDSAPDGYVFFAGTELANGYHVNMKLANDLVYHARLKFDTDDPGKVKIPDGLYVRVTVEHQSGPNSYGFVKVTNDMPKTVVDGVTYIDVPVTQWVDGNGEVLAERYTGQEKSVKLELVGSPEANPLPTSDSNGDLVLKPGQYVNNFKVESYPATYVKPERIETPRENEYVTDIYDTVSLTECTDKFDSYTLEYILNNYNIVTLCPNNVASPSNSGEGAYGDGDLLLKQHFMGALLVRGDVIQMGDHGVADSAMIDAPSVIGGYVPVKGGTWINSRSNNEQDWNAYIGSVNSVLGKTVNGAHANKGYAYEKADGSRYVVATDDYIDWDRLQRTILSASSAIAEAGQVLDVKVTENGMVIDVTAGSNVIIDWPDGICVTINVVTDLPVTAENLPKVPATVVTNRSSGTVYPPKLTINGQNPKEVQGDVENGSGMSVLWNFPNAAKIELTEDNSGFLGHVVAPKADIDFVIGTGGDFNGCLVGNKVQSAAEGHLWPYKQGTLVGFYADIEASKLFNNAVPADGQKFNFILKQLKETIKADESNEAFWEVLQSDAQNKNSTILFKDVHFTQAGTYYFLMAEDTSSPKPNVTLDDTQYLLEVTVTAHAVDGNTVLQIDQDGLKCYKVTDAGSLLTVVETENGKQAEINPNALGALTSTPTWNMETEVITTPVEFLNTSGDTSARATLEGQKTLVDSKGVEKTLTNGQFSFSVTANGDYGEKVDASRLKSSGTNTAAGKIDFGSLTFKEAGDYSYTVRETSSDADGITVDTSSYVVTFHVTENEETGKLAVTKTINQFDQAGNLVQANAPAVSFVNRQEEYTASGSVVIEGVKNLVGRKFREGDTLSVTISGNEKLPDPATQTVTLTAGQTSANFSFPEIEYTLADLGGETSKTFTYTVTETATMAGTTADSKTHTVTVKVTDDGTGTLKVEKTYSDGEKVVFTNTYNASGKTTIEGIKKLEGRKFREGDTLSVTVTGNEKLPVPATQTVTLTAGETSASFSFPEIEYTLADLGGETSKTFTYTVTETATMAGTTADSKTHTVTVKVTDGGTGTLAIEKTYSDGEKVVFTNEYKASGKITLGASKVLNGRAMAPGEFSFELKDATGKVLQTKQNDAKGNITFDEITYTQEDAVKGTITYTVSEVKGKAGGVTYDTNPQTVTVTLTDNGDGTITATADKTAFQVVFTNTYEASGKVKLGAKKELTGKKLTAGMFSFELRDADDKVLQTKENAADGSVSFDEISYTLEDVAKSPITYKIAEVKGEAGGITYDETVREVTVKLVDNGDGTITATASPDTETLVFVNEYTASGKVALGATKVLNGRALKAGEFSFNLKDANGTVLQTKTNAADGSVSFDEISYTLGDLSKSPFTYTISEVKGSVNGVTYDESVQTVKVRLEDNGDGTITATPDKTTAQICFTNSYSGVGEIVLGAKKVLEGKTLEEGQFSFQLKNANGEVLQTKTNAADGSVSFDAIRYTSADLPKSPIAYTICEEKGNLPGVKYDETELTVKVTLTDKGDGTILAVADKTSQELTFTNTYTAAGEIVLEAKKTMNGREPKADEFSFELKSADGQVLQTKKNAADGSVKFDAIAYTLEDVAKSPITYTISEVKGQLPGVTYDETPKTVTVTLKDEGNGTITATATPAAVELVFTNSYDAKGEVTLKAKKVLNGRALEAGQFTLLLMDKSGKVIDRAQNAADGSVTFQTIEYTLADVKNSPIEYSVVEEIPAGAEQNKPLNGYLYDFRSYTVKVTLTDKGDGTIEASPDLNDEQLVFTNTYGADGSVQLDAVKTLEGEALRGGVFRFTLSTKDGELLQTKTNDADGKVSFDPITYSIDDVAQSPYVYLIRELDGKNEKYTYDDTEFEVSVALKDNGDGTITATPTRTGEQVEFVNTAYAEGDIVLGARKVLEGETLREGQFSFELKDASGKVLQTKQNDARGAVTFDAITYTLEDLPKSPITYTVSEVASTNKRYTCDSTVYTVKVTLEDNDDGTITATADRTAGELVFVNKANARGGIVLRATKELKGAELQTGQFSFQLKDASGKVLQTKTNDTKGYVTFDPILYTLADVGKSPFTYTVNEVQGSTKGMTYDTTVYTVKVTLIDNGDDTITAKADKTDKQLHFVNSYKEIRAPKTGDSSTILPYVSLMLFAGFGMAWTGNTFRRKKNQD